MTGGYKIIDLYDQSILDTVKINKGQIPDIQGNILKIVVSLGTSRDV